MRLMPVCCCSIQPSHGPPHPTHTYRQLSRFSLTHTHAHVHTHAPQPQPPTTPPNPPTPNPTHQNIVHSTAHLPEQLATTGKVGISSKQIARLIGQVFLQRSAVNLLSSIMDTPDFFCER